MTEAKKLVVVRVKPRALIAVEDLKEVSKPNREAITLWQNPLGFEDLPAEEQPRVKALSGMWQMAMHWFIRLEFYSTARQKYLIPGPRNLRNATKVQGVFLQSLFKLCERVHTFQGGKPTLPYANASMLFLEVAKEIRYWSLMVAYSQPVKSKCMLTREDAAAPLHAIHKELKSLKNPFDPKLQPHEYCLINAALQLVKQNPDFKPKYWNPFLDSFKAWARMLERDPNFKVCNKTIDSKGDSILSINPGKGRTSSAGAK